MPALAIRPATIADAGLVAALAREHAAHEQGPPAGGTADDFAAALAEGAFECLIAEAAGQAARLPAVPGVFSSWTGRRGLFVEDLFVRAEARGLGVGRRLMAELARIARSRGCTRIDLVVDERNLARRFYEQCGPAPGRGLAALSRRRHRPGSAGRRELTSARIVRTVTESRARIGEIPVKAPCSAPSTLGCERCFYPITGVGVLQPGQVAAGWAVAGVLLGLMALG